MRTLLLVLVALLTPLSALSVWVDQEVDNTDSYVAAMEPLASDPDVHNAISVRVSAEVMKRVDPRTFQQHGVHNLVQEAVVSFAGTTAFKTAWTTVHRAAHTAVDQALTNGGNNAVTIDLAPVTEQVKQQLGHDGEGMPFVDRIPVEETRITILESGRLGTLRDVFHGLRIAGVWLPPVTLVLAACAVLPAVRTTGRVRRALVGLGLALTAGAVLLHTAIRAGRRLVLADLPPDMDRPAAGAVYEALTATLRTTAWWVLAAGLALALAAVVLTDRGGVRRTRPRPPRPAATARTPPTPR
ncbi:hypothetical protein ACIHCQ_02250 [Streptomyces sp. NPDC052236]|uniref:hypothetical protein n=1 Tax=Streptomyces sp. NPDC052236 TaxID=3365686 RepID=UPI0037CDF33A